SEIQETLEAFNTPEPPTALPPENLNLWQLLARGYQLESIQHPAIDRELQAFLLRKDSLTRQLKKGEPFLYHILQEVSKRGMPTEIALLPGIESGFRPTAYSRHGAAGLWQFMPATGRYFGLKQDWWYDARRDPLASTDAALDYLQKLNKRFDGDWLLAIASYNAGGGTVARAIRKNLDRNKAVDFWSLDLPAETRQYVPRLLALARLIEHPERYGVVLPPIENDLHFVKVDTGEQIDLKVAAKLAGMNTDELLLLNAGFNRWATHPQGPHHLLLPADKAESFSAKLAQLPEDQRLRWTRYHIQQGDNLGKIARKYGISVQALMQTNNLKNHRIRAGSYLMIPLSSSTTIVASNTTAISKRKVRYQVRKGDSLYAIAKQFGVKVVDLKKWNRLADDRLHPGQKLTVVRTL
ncbi:MAG TPA: LysM peptidoglycan-binding domain-containing protein, partial [Thiolapillus brandeum]|nr:LysM peptidoglycan-binding domain-containing protein [Thiolapillus brandeum]